MHKICQEQRSTRINALILGVVLTLAITATVYADQAGNSFTVTVNVAGTKGSFTPISGADSVFCINHDNKGALGANVIVVCQTGQAIKLGPSEAENPFLPIHGGANRYAANLTDYGSYSGSVDGYISAGTVASWRQVSLTSRDYMELLVAW